MNRRVTGAIAALFASAAIVPVVAWASGPRSLKPIISQAHPEVRWVTPEQLAPWLPGDRVILIDVRSTEEFDVSRIPGAHRMEPGGALPQVEVGPDQKLVVYCSVGWRSAAAADRFRAEGLEALNLSGGIFEWANQGRPLEGPRGKAHTVHPYDWTWGRFLEAERRAVLPSAAKRNDGAPAPNSQ